MIHNLFDEYRFFHKYPNKELEITSKLFGAIIANDLIDGVVLQIALKYVYEALKRDNKMFKFGVIALEKFHAKLPQLQSFSKILQDLTPAYKDEPELVERFLAL